MAIPSEIIPWAIAGAGLVSTAYFAFRKQTTEERKIAHQEEEDAFQQMAELNESRRAMIAELKDQIERQQTEMSQLSRKITEVESKQEQNMKRISDLESEHDKCKTILETVNRQNGELRRQNIELMDFLKRWDGSIGQA